MSPAASRLFVVLVLILASFQGVLAQEQETGLLLGLRYEEAIPAPLPYYVAQSDSNARAVYRTLLLVRRPAGRVVLAGESTGLSIPRRGGLWRADAKRSIYNNWVEDFVWSAPLEQRADLPGIQAYNGEYCKGHRVQLIHFAGPGFLGLEQRSAGYCEDAAHPWYSNTLGVVPIDSTTHVGLPIGEVLGRAGREGLSSGAQRYLNGLRTEEARQRFFPEADEANWTLVHLRGRWQVRGRLDSGEAASADIADYDVVLKPPASLVGYDELHPTWERIKSFAPNVIDAISSPQKDLVVILRPGRITVHPVKKDAIANATLEIPVQPGATLVMAQWTSSNSAAWARALRARPDSSMVGWQSGRP